MPAPNRQRESSLDVDNDAGAFVAVAAGSTMYGVTFTTTTIIVVRVPARR